ncbi:hypothetical protein [Pseudomonas vranovensis]|uniref:DUF4175 domain-containing protein n=1 Tax=Pseudomonas vranovensis TaxID=321661 RepID=A0A423DV55_9PSED|nr:hypothetical protein [Pseudomonas vranovensis]ROL76063.1 hypothetical protein BHU25_07620 [Pseudomonas vranovensis]
MKCQSSGFWSVFGMPTVIALLGALGLFAALLGDGWWDALAWLGLGLPALYSLRALLPVRRS